MTEMQAPPTALRVPGLACEETLTPAGRFLLRGVLPPSVICLLATGALAVSYPLFHTLAELGSVLIAVMAMVVASLSLSFTRNHFSVFVAIVLGWSGLLDLAHTLSLPSLGLLPGGVDPLLQFGIASRLLQAVALAVAPFWLRRCVRPAPLHLACAGMVVLVYLGVTSGRFPAVHLADGRMADWRVVAEWTVTGLLLASVVSFWRHRALLSPWVFRSMLTVSLCLLGSELAFMHYARMNDLESTIGHLLKIVAYWFVYLALVRHTLCEPFGMLARAASRYDAIPDPTLVVGADGRIRQCNTAAAALVGRPPELLVGESSHHLFHDPQVEPGDCPVCARLQGGVTNLMVELRLAETGREVECHVAPFVDGGGARVEVIRDITPRRELERERERSEQRFRKVFEASPLPMQIYSVSTRRLTDLNEAHRRWLGYELAEIDTPERWFAKVAARQEGDDHDWPGLLAQALRGRTVRTRELVLRCKSGQERIAQGTLTLARDDLILAWTDLTEIRQHERSLRESEQRFRGMIEQTISGIFVCRQGRFIYVNPRFSEIVGWLPEELVGRSVRLFASGRATLEDACRRLQSGEVRSVVQTLPLQRRDGRHIELGLHAAAITWDDGRPAIIVMAQDITERKQAEDQIAHYVKQLERAMKGTLQAVSNMVEIRDPYTAGHERRVGLIARAIGAELGWPAARCETLELAGLVHDIGKIAIPAEILSKPTRLSPLEMELMRGHAQAGYDILKDIPFAGPVAQIIHQHHERMDGSGYPQRLAGEAILPEARVLAVADLLESMSAHRPYRPALGIEAALAELERGSGQLYDAEVVAATLRLVRERGYRLPQ